LPAGYSYPDKQAGKFRLAVERAVMAQTGTIDVWQAALIHAATEYAKLAQKNRYDVRRATAAGLMTPELGLQFDAEYRRNLDARDRRLHALGLAPTNPPPDALGDLYANLGDEPDPEPIDAENAAGATQGPSDD
jgi:hypothetical protein